MTSWSLAIARSHLILLAACSRAAAPADARDGPDAQTTTEATDAGATTASPGTKSCVFAECVRRHEWAQADVAYASVSDAAKQAPEVAIARARTLLGLGRTADALATLDEIEPRAEAFAATLLRVRVDVLRADAATLRRNPVAAKAAAAVLAKSRDPRMQLEAVPLLDDDALARSILNRLATGRGTPKDVAIAARRLRATRSGRDRETDLRWLFVHAPTAADAPPSGTLTAYDWMRRADGLARQGNADAALAANALADQAAQGAAEKRDVLRHRAYLLYKSRTHYLEAAELLGTLGRGGAAHRDEDAFHAARALSRADHDDEAIAAYGALSRAKPKSEWGMRAAYFVGYLRALHGEWAQSETALTHFVSMRPPIPEVRDARRFLAIGAYAQGQWALARDRFRALAREARSPDETLRAGHLAALADVRGGGTDGPATWRTVAASDPFSFSGVMARARLRSTGQAVPPLPDLGPAGTTVGLSAVSSALHAAGLDDDAAAMLGAELWHAPVREACAAFEAVDRAYDRAISAAAIDRDEPWACRFPTPYKVWINEESRVSPALVWSVMRQESGFDPRATSPALARGLLQLVDDTARATERELHLAPGDLYDPKHNIAVGTKYLGKLLDRFNGQVPLAVAAYNAGPEAIARWLGRTQLADLEAFVEFIPYQETRNYVARVLSNYARYLWLTERRELELSPALTPPGH